MERKSFVFYKDWRDAIKDLPDDIRLELYDCIMEYAFAGKVEGLKPMVSIAFNFIKTAMDRNSEKYEGIIEKRRSAGKKGGLTKKQTVANEANAKDAKQTVANEADNVNDNVNDNVSTNVDEEKESTNVYSLSSAKAKQLPPDTTFQCQCVSESTGVQCQRKALYDIDGKLYCNQHSKPVIGEILGAVDSQPVKSDFDKFNDWIKSNAPNVMKLKRQITEPQFKKLKATYDTDKMTDILCRMDNYKDLTKKYVSVYQTFLNWAKREYGDV